MQLHEDHELDLYPTMPISILRGVGEEGHGTVRALAPLAPAQASRGAHARWAALHSHLAYPPSLHPE